MFAIIQAGGKQYKAAPGTVLKLEKIEGEPGDEIFLDQVLLVSEGDEVHVGRPNLPDKVVRARIVDQGRHRKIRVLKFKRRKGYRKQQGHRQYYTAVQIEGIEDRAADV